MKQQLIAYQKQYGLLEEVLCTRDERNYFLKLLKEGKPLPPNVTYRQDHEVCIWDEQEIAEYERLLSLGQPLPEGISTYQMYDETTSSMKNGFYTFAAFFKQVNTDLTQQEAEQYLRYKNTDYLETIKNCMVFFATLTAIGLAGWIAYTIWLIDLIG